MTSAAVPEPGVDGATSVPRPPMARLPEWGDPVERARTRLTEQLDRCSSLDQLPLAQHPDIFAQIHSQLQSTLAEIDAR